MITLNDQEVKLFSHEFQKELARLLECCETQNHWAKMIMPRLQIQQITQHLKGIAEIAPGKMRNWIEARKFKVFNKPSMGLSDVLMEPTKDKLSINEGNGPVIPRYLRIVPREDIFDTLLKIHLQNNHSTLRETLHLVRSIISNIPRYLVHKFILLCPICSNNGATTNSAGLPYTPSRRCVIKARRRRKLMDQFQVDVLELKENPDGAYSYILHCMDHITGFHWLFPLAQICPAEAAQNLVWGIFSLFGFPSELVSDYGKDFSTKVIVEVKKLWPDKLEIKNYLEGNSYKGEVTRRNIRNVTRFIDDMTAKRNAMGDTRRKWSEWLPEIQFMLNSTVLDVRTGKTPYEKVFRSNPITMPDKIKFPGSRNCNPALEKQRSPHKGWRGYNFPGELSQEYVMEEIVGYGDTLHHDAHEEAREHGGNVVVVDVGGVEHSVRGVANGSAASYDSASACGYSQYTILQNPNDTTVDGTDGGEQLIDSQEQYDPTDGTTTTIVEGSVPTTHIVGVAGTSDATASDQHQPYASKLNQLHLEDIEYMDEHSTTEKWVTLSADGGELEVAEIKPSVQEIKIASGANSNYRFETIPRKAEYVTSGNGYINQLVASNQATLGTSSVKTLNSSKIITFRPSTSVKGTRSIQLKSTSSPRSTPPKIPLGTNLNSEANRITLTTGRNSLKVTGATSIPTRTNTTTTPQTRLQPRSAFSTISVGRAVPPSVGSPSVSKRSVPNTIKLPSPNKRFKTETGSGALPSTSGVGRTLPSVVHTNIVTRPLLKIPGARKPATSGGKSSNNASVLEVGTLAGKEYLDDSENSSEEEDEDEEEEFDDGVLSDGEDELEEEEEDDSNDYYES